MKTCSRCKVEKEHAAFSKSRNAKDGLQSKCRDCARAYREANKERLAEYGREYDRKNAERISERKREYHAANRDRITARQRGYHAANKEHISERKRKYHAANKDRIAVHQREYYAANRERYAEQQRKWNQANPERAKSYRHARRARMVGLYGEKPDHKRIAEQMELLKDDPCLWCGTTEFPDGYHWDHIVPLAKGGLHVWWNIAKSCPADNLSKSDKIPPLVGLYDW